MYEYIKNKMGKGRYVASIFEMMRVVRIYRAQIIGLANLRGGFIQMDTNYNLQIFNDVS